ncbi:MAG: hypothetical protein LJE95_04905 [Acidobacteria bacterium]|nr:hypothetical protein [Acidobacteriota bacterium]
MREVSPTEVAYALTPSGLETVRLTRSATGSRLDAGVDSRALEVGTPLVDGDGRLVGVAEREESHGNGRRTVVAGPANLRGFFSEYLFRTSVSPAVIHRDTRQLVVETTRLLGSFAGLKGTVTLEAEGSPPQTRELMGGPEKKAATLPVVAPPSGGSLRKVRVTVSFRGGDGRAVARKRYRVSADDKMAAGALPQPTPIPLGTNSAAALSASDAEKRTRSGRATRLSGIAARVSLHKDKDGSSVTLTNRTLEAGGDSSSGAYRFLKSKQDRSDAVRLERLGAEYAYLQGEKNRISAGRKQRGEVVWSHDELNRQYRDSYKRLSEIRTEAGAIVRRLLSRKICRCDDGLWYRAAEAPCHGCVLRDPTSSSKSGYVMRR